MSLIGTIYKQPSERASAGIDYTRWLRAAVLQAVDVYASPVADLVDPFPVEVWGAYITPDGKAVNLVVESGSVGSDVLVTLTARSSSQLIRKDTMLVRVEEDLL